MHSGDIQNFEKSAPDEQLDASWLERLAGRWRLHAMIAIVAIMLGLFAVTTIPREADPEVIIPIGFVSVPFPGAAPEDVEELITDKLEQSFQNLENIAQITSSSSLGGASVVVEFAAGVDVDRSIDDIKDAVDSVKSQLPDDSEEPIVGKIRINDIAIVTFSLSGNYTDAQLTEFARLIQGEIEGISGVSRVDIVGELIREWKVVLNQESLQSRGIAANEVIASIQQNNVDLPIGTIEFDGKEFNVKTSSRFEAIDDLQNLPIRSVNGSAVLLGDIARVEDSFRERSTVSRLSLNGADPQPAISISVRKQTGGNILDIVDQAEAKIAQLQETRLPTDLNVIKTNDNAQFIRDDLQTLGMSGVQAVIIIAILLFLVLSWKEATLAAFAIPITYLMSIAILNAIGLTLNSLTLFSLVLALGLLVDVFIVIVEGFHDFIKDGCSPLESAKRAINTYKIPLLSGTLTTIGAFLPMLLVSGVVGQFMKSLPITIAIVLGSSLFVALTLLPAFASRFIHTGLRRGRIAEVRSQAINTLKNWYATKLETLLRNKRKRRLFLGAAWAALAVTLSFPVLGILSSELFPPSDFDFFVVNIETPAGNTLKVTESFVAQVEKQLQQRPEISNFVTSVGSGQSLAALNPFDVGGIGSTEHLASITVNLVDAKDRNLKSFEIMDEMREKFRSFKQAKVTVPDFGAGPPVGSPIEVRITGSNRDALDDVARDVERLLNEIPGTIDVDDDIQETSGEFVFRGNKERLAAFGLSELQVASTIRTALTGVEASSISINGDDVDIRVSLEDQSVADITQLKNLLISTPEGQGIPLSLVAEGTLESSVASIAHEDRERIVRVLANTQDRLPAEVFADFEARRDELTIPDGVTLSIGGELEEITESFNELFQTMIISVLIILTILVVQFNSFKQPLIILLSLPLAFIGVIIGLTVFRLPFSFPAFLGLVGLAGIAVNDAIILIDRINQLIRKGGKSRFEAILQGGKDRLQPILLTTATTILGVIPLLFINELWLGLGVALISGLLFASVLTLVVVPILYNAFGLKEGRKD